MFDGLTFHEVRTNNSEDLALLDAFFDQMGAESAAFFNRGDGNRRFMRDSLSGKSETKDIHWIALAGGRVVGYVFLKNIEVSNPWLGIAVSEDMKGRRLGSRLIDLAKEFCRRNKKGGIFLITHVANVRGQGLYERCAFKKLGIHTCGEILYFWDSAHGA